MLDFSNPPKLFGSILGCIISYAQDDDVSKHENLQQTFPFVS